jgi:putative Mn2+ efflux pump MntP
MNFHDRRDILASNVDNLAVGVAFGVQGARIAAIQNMIIAALTMTGTALAVSSGRALSLLISPSAASKLGSLIIIAIGAGTLLASLSAFRTPIWVGDRHARRLTSRSYSMRVVRSPSAKRSSSASRSRSTTSVPA